MITADYASARVLIYSRYSRGLGHLVRRRARTGENCSAALKTLLRAAVLIAATLLPAAGPRAADDAFTADARAGAQFRSMYFKRDLPRDVVQETWAAGGWLWGQTGYWRDFLSFGGAAYGALRWYGPNDRDGAGLLKPGQESYAVIGQAYSKLKWEEQTLTLYRQAIGSNPQKAEGVRPLASDMNYLGARDIRMSPMTYEAAMLGGPLGDSLRYQAGYVADVKDINSDKFVSMSRLAGVASEKEGMWTGGLQWSPKKDVWLQGYYYSVKDTLRIGYADIDWVTRTSKDAYYRFAAQYTDQRSDGANLLTGHAFKTWSAAAYGEYGWHWLKVYGALARTGEGAAIRTPYSQGPFFITQRIKNFDRAGEDALLLGTTFDFAAAGLPGLSFDVNVADGRNAINAASGAALPKWREYDTDLAYGFAANSPLAGMRLRLRWATLGQDYGTYTNRTNDLRFDVNWAITFN